MDAREGSSSRWVEVPKLALQLGLKAGVSAWQTPGSGTVAPTPAVAGRKLLYSEKIAVQ